MTITRRSFYPLALVLASASIWSGQAFMVVPSASTLMEKLSAVKQQHNSNNDNNNKSLSHSVTTAAAGLVLASTLFFPTHPALADGQTKEFKYPPIDFTDTTRCEIKNSGIGQANAARDKLYDLRMCQLQNVKAVGYDLSGVIMTKTDVSGADFKEAYFSKGYLRDSNFEGTDFSNAIVDRASFKGSSLKGVLFTNSVLTGTSFEGANVENADFSDAALGVYDVRNLCTNPTLKGTNAVTGQDTRLSAGCK